MKKIFWLVFFFPLLISVQSITVTGTPWAVFLAYPFDDVYSPDPQVQIDVKPGGVSYMVQVQRDNMTWQPALHLSIKRTGDGSGNPAGVPVGGDSWIELDTGAQEFFTGASKNRNNIPCQYLLESDWPIEGSYATTVTFTIIEY